MSRDRAPRQCSTTAASPLSLSQTTTVGVDMSETSPARWHGKSGPGLSEITGVPASPREGPLFWVGQLLFSPGQSRAPLCGHCNGWQGTLSQLWVGRTHSPLGAGCGLGSPERSERQAVGGSGPLHPGGSVAPFWIGITGNKRGKCCTGAGPALSPPSGGGCGSQEASWPFRNLSIQSLYRLGAHPQVVPLSAPL